MKKWKKSYTVDQHFKGSIVPLLIDNRGFFLCIFVRSRVSFNLKMAYSVFRDSEVWDANTKKTQNGDMVFCDFRLCKMKVSPQNEFLQLLAQILI